MGERVRVSAPGRGRDEIGEPLVGQPPVDQGQRGALDQRVVLQSDDEPGRQRSIGERATVGVPVRQRLQQHEVQECAQKSGPGLCGASCG